MLFGKCTCVISENISLPLIVYREVNSGDAIGTSSSYDLCE
jgi:hypothetical protein